MPNPTSFNLLNHHRFIQRHGERVQVYPASKCPCGAGVDPGRANPNCTVCGGLGFRYGTAVEIIAMVTGVQREKMLREVGLVEPGDVMLSLSPFETVPVGDWDVIRFTWDEGQPYEGELVVRGLGPTDRLKYTPKKVISCFSVNRQMDAVTAYVEGRDFSVSGNTVTWLTGGGAVNPLPEQPYSIKYDVRTYDWVVFPTPGQRVERGTNLGRKVILKKRALPNPKP